MAGLQKAIAQLMEGRQERPERADPLGLTQLLEQLLQRVGPAERAHAEAFARQLFDKTPAVVASADDVASLAGMTASALGFLRRRGPAPMAIRVVAPLAERDGWSSPLTVVESVLDDRPFIVDTLCHAIEAQGGEIRLLLHPVLGVERAADGSLARVGGPDSAPTRESFFHAEVANLPATALLQQQLAERLRQLLRVTGDYRAMRERIAAGAADLRARPLPPPWDDDRDEVVAFLEWLAEKRFVFLGYREYDLRGVASAAESMVRPGSSLGLLRDESRSRFRTPQPLPADLASRLERPPLLVVSKTHSLSPIHRAVSMDDISIKQIDGGGRVVGVRRLLGLFTGRAYGDAASEIPVVRRQLSALLARAGTVAESHDERELLALFNSLPREELLASESGDIHQLIGTIRAADAQSGMQVICRPDALRRGLFAVVLVPRPLFSTELHARISASVRGRLGAHVLHEQVALDDRPVARLHYYCAVAPEVLAAPPVEALRADVAALLRTWDDELREVLAGAGSSLEAERLSSRYARALPAAYKASVEVGEAARDVRCLEAMSATGRAQIELIDAPTDGAPHTLKLYLVNESLALSDFVPVLENLGMRVLGQHMVDLDLPEVESACIHAFALAPHDRAADVRRAAPRLVAALHALRADSVDDDRLNALILTAGLEWRAVDLLRAYMGFLCQVGPASRPTLIEALRAHPDSAARLFAWAAAAFDPTASALPAAERAAGPVREARAQFLAGLDAVATLTHDRALRALGAVVAATVRTNFFTAPAGAPIALKFDGAQLAEVTAGAAAIETWVHARQVEGVHLRAGRVARGGVRVSDRPDDFRAEILALMRTQGLKNAVIVPVGAKGGFVIRGRARNPADAAARTEAGYRAFIEALLSITDNLDKGQVVPPHGQLVYDGPDPYLVVAADKGTGALSDAANEIAAAHRFWLGDACASGGRNGYEHKRLGITACGAWESARRHLREMGRDLDREMVTVAGIGDMSGDVFGNGLLRSRHLRLLAAFNHRDIFLDPDPDPELSYRERERLYHLPHSEWTDYAPTCLSRGGNVYPRSAKAIPLAPEARTLLGLQSSTPSGEDVVRAILRLPVDLLWNGGIGTYVKASDERHAEVADSANDAVRIDASELRAAVVVEGGNLGLTQRARVEYALGGGRINSDAIDNAAGVDLSDHEVNLKIALQPLVVSRELPVEMRNAQLAEISDSVCARVLARTRSQVLALSLDQQRSRTRLAPFRDLISILEAEAGLDRQRAQLPTRETLRARRGVCLGLTRPELAMLLAHTKLDLQRRIVESPLPDDPALEGYLRSYFPEVILQRFAGSVRDHPLRREIMSVGLVNDLIDTMGMTFLVGAVRDTGRDVLDVIRAWAAAVRITGVAAARDELAAVRDRLTAEAEQRAALELAGALERAARWLVQAHTAEVGIAELVTRFREPVTELLDHWPEPHGHDRRAASAGALADLASAGVDPTLAQHLVRLGRADQALEIVQIAHVANAPAALTAEAYMRSAALVDLDWIGAMLPSALPGEDRWEPRAVASLLDVLLDLRRQLTLAVLAHRRGGIAVEELLQIYAATCQEQLDVVNGLLTDLKAAAPPTLPALLVLIREVGRLVRSPDRGKAW